MKNLIKIFFEGSGESVFELSEEVKSILLQPTRLIRILKFWDHPTIHPVSGTSAEKLQKQLEEHSEIFLKKN